jgi:agmatine deiminase
MITDKETNFVYFSDRIKTDKRYTSFWERLEPLLIENNISFGFIENTKDIWCRDYMPIQISEKNFVEFKFYPDYLQEPEYSSILTIQSDIKIIEDLKPTKSALIIDGGNVIKSKNAVILTEKIFIENIAYTKEEVISELKMLFKIDNILIIPMHAKSYDLSGHADGMVRFLDDNTLLVSDYSSYALTWKKKMDGALEKTGLKIITFPSVDYLERNSDADFTAIGIYINFAQIGDKILFPLFGVPGEKDIQAMGLTQSLYPDCKIIPINALDIAEQGGVLNCITWNIKRD